MQGRILSIPDSVTGPHPCASIDAPASLAESARVYRCIPRMLSTWITRIRSLPAIGLAAVLLMSLAACGGGGNGDDAPPPAGPPPTTPPPGSPPPGTPPPGAPAPTSGLDARPANTSCVAPARPAGNVALEAVRFTDLTFPSPLGLQQAPNDSSRWFVIQQDGV